jgi:hypothetical protein
MQANVEDDATAYFPPKLEVLVAWSLCFRSHETYRNYKGYVKTACLTLGVSVQVCCHTLPH